MKINIFFFISRFTFGGAGNAIFTFLNNLDRKKFNLHIFFLGNSEYEKILPKYIKYYKLKINYNIFKTFFCFFEIRKILNQQTKDFKKNIFISNIHYSNVLSIIFLKKIKNLKLILFERTSIKELDIYENVFSFIKNKIVKFLIGLTYSQADVILTNSKTSSLELRKFNIRSKVVYSGPIKTLHKSKNKKKKKLFFNLIAVGRLSTQKDYFTLLKAINLLDYKNFRLSIFGNGELRKKIEKFIKDNELNQYVKLRGHEKDKKKIYKKADLLIHAAIFEGMPNVIVEAMNFRVPVIAADSPGGTRELLESGKYGQLFEPQNHIELAKKIKDFILNPEKLNKKIMNTKPILKKFTHESSTNSLEKILNGI